jgi:hypothetical protein
MYTGEWRMIMQFTDAMEDKIWNAILKEHIATIQ